ncbi:signal peptidase I [soil metagenome]
MNKNKIKIKETAKPAPKSPPKSAVREYFQSFVVTLVMAIFGMTFMVQAVTVPTGSMQNTINIGDYLLVNKFIFPPGGKPLPFLPQREIKRGDIIVFKYPGNKVHPEYDRQRQPPTVPYQINYVKRVIGLPGETVEFRNNQVFINGQLLPEHRITADSPTDAASDTESEAALQIKSEEPRQENENYDVYYSERTMKVVQAGQDLSRAGYEFAIPGKPMVVPDDSYFVMGDSRDQSDDSRSWGFVNRDLVIGRAMFVYWSCDRAAGEGGFFGCLTHPRLARIGKLIR